MVDAKANATIVIAHFNEDVTWINTITEHNIVIYSKGDQNTLSNATATATATIKLPNLGRESHTYVHHIITNYDTLSPVTVFLQANPFDHIKNVDSLISEAKTHPSGLSQNAHVHDVGNCSAFHGFTIRQHMGQVVEEYKDGLNMGEWLKDIQGIQDIQCIQEFPILDLKKSPRWYIGGCFAATKDAIQSVPLQMWNKIYDSLSYSMNPVTGHYMERSWYMLMDLEKANAKTAITTANAVKRPTIL